MVGTSQFPFGDSFGLFSGMFVLFFSEKVSEPTPLEVDFSKKSQVPEEIHTLKFQVPEILLKSCVESPKFTLEKSQVP